MMEISPIIIDSREKERTTRFKQYLANQKLIKDGEYWRITTTNKEYLYFDGIEVRKIEIGDYLFANMAVEYKSAGDLENSVWGKDKRLNEQIDNAIKAIDNGEIEEYIIVSNVLQNLDLTNYHDINRFEDLNNFFIQFSHDGVHFIPATSEQIAFRDIVNYWRTGVSKTNRTTLNKKYPWNPFMNSLAIVPCLNHNNVNAIYNTYPGHKISELLDLTVNELKNVKSGKKKLGESKAENILKQINLTYG